VPEHLGLLVRRHLDGLRADLDGHFRVLVRQFERVVERPEIFFERQRVSGQLLLIGLDEVVQARDVIEKDELPRSLDRREDPIVILGVLSHPRVAVVDVTRLQIVVETVGHADEPFRQIVRLEPIVGTRVSEVDDQLERLRLERLQRQQNVIDEQVAVHLVHFETTRDVVEDGRVVLLAEARLNDTTRHDARRALLSSTHLIEDVRRFQRFEFFSFVHLRFGHELFELRCRHVVRDPLRVQRTMVGRPEIRQECRHLVERPPSDGLVIASARQIVADLLLMVPQETMKRENIGVADVRHRIGGRDTGRVDLHVARRALLDLTSDVTGAHRLTDRQYEARRQVECRPKVIVETTHVEFFGET
jgi:hypothetical protein